MPASVSLSASSSRVMLSGSGPITNAGRIPAASLQPNAATSMSKVDRPPPARERPARSGDHLVEERLKHLFAVLRHKRGAGNPRIRASVYCSASAGAAAAQKRPKRPNADRDVDDEASVSQVPEVIGELIAGPGGVGGIASPHLRPARDAGFHQVALRPERDLGLEVGQELGPF